VDLSALSELPINKDFIITFQPKQPELFGGKRRFSVGGFSLHKYVGEHNAIQAIIGAFNSSEDKYTKRLRKCGRIDFYRK
jgi:hypothetical protein